MANALTAGEKYCLENCAIKGEIERVDPMQLITKSLTMVNAQWSVNGE